MLQFADMKDVYGEVDGAMLARTGAWLKSRRDGNGGYLRDAKALDTFGRASPEVTDAYITWALVSAGETGLDKEIAKTAKLAETTQDAYQLALATGTLLQRDAGAAPSKAGLAAAAKLARMQAAPARGPTPITRSRRAAGATCRSRPRRSRSSRCSRPTATWRKRARASPGCRRIAAASASGARRRPRCWR